MKPKTLPNGWIWVTLSEACHINPRRPDLSSYSDQTQVTFVPMPAVDQERGVVATPETRDLADVRKGYTFFRENDVLFAKITPCMQNGKSAIARDLSNALGFGSTEFHVLRPKDDVLPEWIHLFVRQRWFRDLAARYFTGSVGQQRVPQSFLEQQQIPLPPLPEQHRIVARIEELMTRIEEAKRLRKEASDGVKDILPSALTRVLSRAEKESWDTLKINEFADVKGGKRLPKGSSFAEGKTPYPYIRVIDFKNGTVDQSDLRFLTPEVERQISRYMISKDDVYISIAGTIGLTGTVPDELDGSNLTENAAKIVIHEGSQVDKRFLVYFLASPMGKTQIDERWKAAGQPKLALKRITTIRVCLPSLDEQRRVVAYLDGIQDQAGHLRRVQSETQGELERTTGSVLATAFRGEL